VPKKPSKKQQAKGYKYTIVPPKSFSDDEYTDEIDDDGDPIPDEMYQIMYAPKPKKATNVDVELIPDSGGYALQELFENAEHFRWVEKIVKATVLWMMKCTEAEQKVIYHKLIQKRTFREIGNALKCAPSTAYEKWDNAKKKGNGLINFQ